MGGKTAMSFAITWPEKLYGLLIADISPLRKESRSSVVSSRHLEILNTILSIDLSGYKSRSGIETFLTSKIKSEETLRLIMKNLKRESDNSFSWKLNAGSLFKNFDRILENVEFDETNHAGITGFPVLFLKGEHSDYLPEKDFREIQRIFPAAELIIIPGAGHWIQSDNPEIVTKCFLRLLG
jgi:pimeloyl-ACP methyl ester carboxylesterase